MKLSTTVIYQHSLLAPKGKIFVDDKLEMRKIFDREYEVLLGGRVLRWTEMHSDLASRIDSEGWLSIMEPVLYEDS